MAAERADLVEPEAGPLPEFGGLRDAGVLQPMTPDVQADALPELAHDAKDATRLEPAAAVLPPLAAGLKERPWH